MKCLQRELLNHEKVFEHVPLLSLWCSAGPGEECACQVQGHFLGLLSRWRDSQLPAGIYYAVGVIQLIRYSSSNRKEETTGSVKGRNYVEVLVTILPGENA